MSRIKLTPPIQLQCGISEERPLWSNGIWIGWAV